MVSYPQVVDTFAAHRVSKVLSGSVLSALLPQSIGAVDVRGVVAPCLQWMQITPSCITNKCTGVRLISLLALQPAYFLLFCTSPAVLLTAALFEQCATTCEYRRA